MRTYKTHSEQSFFDLVVQLKGNINSMDGILRQINDLNVVVPFGTDIEYEFERNTTLDEIDNKGYIFSTWENPEDVGASIFAVETSGESNVNASLYRAHSEQSFFDLVLQLKGNLNKMGEILRQVTDLNFAIPFGSIIEYTIEGTLITKTIDNKSLIFATYENIEGLGGEPQLLIGGPDESDLVITGDDGSFVITG